MRGEEQSRLSLGSYGRPRMTVELKEIGLDIGHRRVGRLMRQNGISFVRYHRPAVVCLQTMSIRVGQVGFSVHFLSSRKRTLARTTSFLMIAVMATFGGLPRLII